MASLALCLLHGCSDPGSSGDAPTVDTTPSTLAAFDSQSLAGGLAEALSTALVEEDIDRVDRLLAEGVSGSAVQPAAASPLLAEVQELLADHRVLQYRLDVVEATPAPDGRVDLVLRETRTLAAGDGSLRTEMGRLTAEARAEPRAGGGVVLRLAAWERTPQATISQAGVPFLGESVSVEVALLGEGDLSGLAVDLDGEPLALSAADGTEALIDTVAPMTAGLHTLTVRAAALGEVRHPLPVRGEELAQVQRLGPGGRYLSVATIGGETFAGKATGGALAYFPGADRFPYIYGLVGEGEEGRLESIAITPDGPDLLLIGGGHDRVDRWASDGAVTDRLVIASDEAYPLHNDGLPAAPSRIVPDRDGLWLLGSDAGVTRLTDGDPRFATVLTRGDGLPSNVVPAVITRGAGDVVFAGLGGAARWDGTALTPIELHTDITIGNDAIANLEGLFGALAQAIFDHTPLATLMVGETSIEAIVGGALPKELLVFAATQDDAGHLWFGTLGGGLWVVDGDGTHARRFTRSDGLLSNVVLSLTPDPTGGIWAGTDEGAAHIKLVDGEPAFRDLTPGNGLGRAVRQVAVGDNGDVWFATDEGLFRLTERRVEVRGVLRDATGAAVAGAAITVEGGAASAVTDSTGSYVLQGVPVGKQQLRVVSAGIGDRLYSVVAGAGGEVGSAFRLVKVSGDRQFGDPGDTLPLPLVVRLEDEFGNPVAGEAVLARVRTGAGLLAPGSSDGSQPSGTAPSLVLTTNESGEAIFALSLGEGDVDAQVRVSAAGRVVDFLAIVGRVDLPDTPHDLAARELAGGQRVAVVAERQTGLAIIDASDPLDPVQRAVITLPGEPQRIALVGDLAYVAGFNPTGLYTVDLASPLTLAAESEPNDDTGTATLLSPPQTVQGTVAASDPGAAGLLGSGDDVEDLYSFTLTEAATLAFGLTGGTGLTLTLFDDTLVEVASTGYAIPATPLDAGIYYLGVSADDAQAVEETPYVVTVAAAIDLTALGSSARPAQVAVDGSHAYLGVRDNETLSGALQVISVADPLHPQVVGSVDLPQRVEGVAVRGQLAIVTNRGGGEAAPPYRGLIAVDVSVPTAPAIAGQLDGVFSLSGVAVAGNHAYFIDSSDESAFAVADVADGSAISLTGEVAISPVEVNGGSTLAVADGYAYFAALDLGVQVFDVQDPASPRLVAVLDTPSTAEAVVYADPFLYVADAIFGVLVIQGPGGDRSDADGDGTIDFFDAFPNDAGESLDVDHDTVGDNADPDDDNDGFTDEEEASSGTDPKNPKNFPISPPDLSQGNTIYVDAAAPLGGNGSTATPYRTITEAVRAVRDLREAGIADPFTIEIEAGTYASIANGEVFPLNLNALDQVTVVGAGPTDTLLDAAQEGIVAFTQFSDDLTIEGIGLLSGEVGFLANQVNRLTVRDCRAADNANAGLSVGINAFDVVFEGNAAEDNGQNGIELFETATGRIVDNVVQGNGWSGILVKDGAVATEISGNEARDNGNHGIAVASGAEAELINGNVATSNTYNGIQVWDGGHVVEASANNLLDNGSGGIAVWHNSTADLVTGNVATQNGFDGLLIYDGSTVASLTGNLFANNGRAGVMVTGAAAVTSAADNIYRANVAFGISAQSNASYTGIGDLVEGQSDPKPGSNAVGVIAANATLSLTNATVRDTVDGIGILGTYWTRELTLIDTTVENNGAEGVVLSHWSYAIIQGGSFSHNATDGILIRAFEPLTGQSWPSSASIAEAGAPVTIADNGDDGIDIETSDGSTATYDLGNIIFSGNGEQDIEQ